MISLNGDLVQMDIQKDFLEVWGHKVTVTGFIPYVAASDYPQALKLIYLYCIEGWWNYKDELISLGICTEEQFKERLGRA